MKRILLSRTNWMFVGMFVFGGLNAVVPMVPAEYSASLSLVLGFMGMYFKMNPSQDYSK